MPNLAKPRVRCGRVASPRMRASRVRGFSDVRVIEIPIRVRVLILRDKGGPTGAALAKSPNEPGD
jgi:hypothetical protein